MRVRIKTQITPQKAGGMANIDNVLLGALAAGVTRWADLAHQNVVQSVSVAGRVSRPGKPPAVDTGALRASIKVVQTPGKLFSYRVQAEQFYGIMLEYGTSKMKKRPFLKRGVRKVRKQGEVLVREEVAKVLR